MTKTKMQASKITLESDNADYAIVLDGNCIVGHIYWDDQDPNNEGWAYKASLPGEFGQHSGPLGFDGINNVNPRKSSSVTTLRRHLLSSLRWEGLV